MPVIHYSYAKLFRNTMQIYRKFPKDERFFPIFTKVSQLKTCQRGKAWGTGKKTRPEQILTNMYNQYLHNNKKTPEFSYVFTKQHTEFCYHDNIRHLEKVFIAINTRKNILLLHEKH